MRESIEHGMQSKIGFISLHGGLYDEELIQQVYRQCRNMLLSSALHLVEAASRDLADTKNMREAAALFRETDVDLLLVLFCSWVPEHILVQLTNELLHVPVLLWAVNQPDQLVSPCGLLSAASNFKKQGTTFFHILGDPNPETLAKIETVARSCTIAKRLRQSRIGIVGYPPSGMIDVTFSEADILTLGPVLIHIDTLDLLRTSEHVDQSCVEKEVASVRDSGWRVEIPEDELSESVMMYCGLKTLVREYDLSAIGVRCWPELREERKVPVCFGLARLSDEGIAGFCEGDVNKGALQTVMQWLTGLPAFLADPSSFDFQSNTMELWHCGALGTKAASNKQEVTIKPNLFSRRGASMCFSFMEGPVTVASLAGPVEGSFNLLACSGVASYGEPESGNQTRIRFEIPLKQLFEEMVENGMGHHLIVGSGNVVEELKCFAMLAGLRFIPQGIQHALNE